MGQNGRSADYDGLILRPRLHSPFSSRVKSNLVIAFLKNSLKTPSMYLVVKRALLAAILFNVVINIVALFDSPADSVFLAKQVVCETQDRLLATDHKLILAGDLTKCIIEPPSQPLKQLATWLKLPGTKHLLHFYYTAPNLKTIDRNLSLRGPPQAS